MLDLTVNFQYMIWNHMQLYKHTFQIYIRILAAMFRLVDMGFSGMFSDPHFSNIRPTYGAGFNQYGEHGFQWDVLRSSLDIYRAYRWIKFNQIDGHGFQWDVLRSSLYIYRAYSWIWFNQIGRHGFQWDVLRSSLDIQSLQLNLV